MDSNSDHMNEIFMPNVIHSIDQFTLANMNGTLKIDSNILVSAMNDCLLQYGKKVNNASIHFDGTDYYLSYRLSKSYIITYHLEVKNYQLTLNRKSWPSEHSISTESCKKNTLVTNWKKPIKYICTEENCECNHVVVLGALDNVPKPHYLLKAIEKASRMK